jgi:DNA-binding response OmpR family regulator
MRINGIDLTVFSPLERRFLVTLGMASPRRVYNNELIEAMWPNPDAEPDSAYTALNVVAYRVRKKMASQEWSILSTRGQQGYWLDKPNGWNTCTKA